MQLIKQLLCSLKYIFKYCVKLKYPLLKTTKYETTLITNRSVEKREIVIKNVSQCY